MRVRVYGEFPKTEADGLIALELVDAAAVRELKVAGDLMSTCGRIVRATINVDDDGVGGGVTDRLREVFAEKNYASQSMRVTTAANPATKC